MKLLVDLSAYQSTESGIFRYAYRIIKGFVSNQYSDIILYNNSAIHDFVKKEFPEYECIKADIKNSGFLCLVTNSYRWTKQINSIKCDAVFSPQLYSTYFFCNKPIFQTIHDLHSIKVLSFKIKLVTFFTIPIIILRSRKTITISDYVKKDILHFYPFLKNRKIETIYNAVIINKPNNIPKIAFPYILYVSTLYRYKNVITLIKAYNKIKKHINQKLIIIGKISDSSWDNEVKPYIEKNKLQDSIIHISNSISDQELANYYSQADLFVHPSLMEGFGYTPIEAAMHKVPVVTNKETALYETTMGLLNYYEPADDYNSLAESMKNILCNRDKNNFNKLDYISKAFAEEYSCSGQSRKIYDLINNSLTLKE